MFSKEPETHADDLEQAALKSYSVASVFGTPDPKAGQHRPNRSRHERPEFVTVVKKTRSFTRPGEKPRAAEANPAVAKPAGATPAPASSARMNAETFFKPKF